MRRFLFPALALLVALGLAWLRDGSPTSPDGNGAAPDRITVQVPTPAPIGKGHSETPEGELVEMQLDPDATQSLQSLLRDLARAATSQALAPEDVLEELLTQRRHGEIDAARFHTLLDDLLGRHPEMAPELANRFGEITSRETLLALARLLAPHSGIDEVAIPLLRALDHGDESTRELAAYGFLGTRREDALEHLLNIYDRETEPAAIRASAGYVVAGSLPHLSPLTRRALVDRSVQILEEIRSPRAVRIEAIEILCNAPLSTEVIERIRQIAERDRDPLLRLHCARLLHRDVPFPPGPLPLSIQEALRGAQQEAE